MDIRDLVNPADLIGVVRALRLPQFTLGNFFPTDTRESVDYSFVRSNADSLQAAPVRAFDAESPIGTRPGVSKTQGSLPPISQKIPMTEGERLMMEALFRDNDTSRNRVAQEVFNDAARMVRSVQARVELARGDALTDGIITFAENGVNFVLDFGVPAVHKVAAATAWSDPAADIINDLRTWVQVYVDTNGAPPERAITSTRVVSYMLRNTGIRQLLAGFASTPGIVTREQLASILEAFGLPSIETYDVKVYDAAGDKVRVIPDDRFIMLPGGGDVLGQTQYGVTAEALELAGEGLIDAPDTPGIVAVNWKTKDPVQIWTKAAAVALPVIINPDLLFTADVA